MAVEYVVVDTETTSKYINERDGYQPARVVELAWKVGEGKTQSHVIRPNGFVISPDVNEIHPINHRFAVMNGVEGHVVYRMLIDDLRRVEASGKKVVLVGHNIARYDKPLIVMELGRYKFADDVVDWFMGLEVYDTLIEARAKLCDELEQFNLSAVYTHVRGEEFMDAHRAGPDVDATKIVLDYLLRIKG